MEQDATMTNMEWFRAAQETFEEALESGHFDLAGDLIKDIQDKGFYQAAEQYQNKLQAAKREDLEMHE